MKAPGGSDLITEALQSRELSLAGSRSQSFEVGRRADMQAATRSREQPWLTSSREMGPHS